MRSNDEYLYLISSNATKEYILDILETLSSPFGTVHHFRYQLKWLDKDLRDKIPKKGEWRKKEFRDRIPMIGKKGNNELENIKLVVCYLYQEIKRDQWQWIDIYPIRAGVLMDAYKIGDDDDDVAHFYFKVDNYVSYDKQDFTEILKKISGDKFGQAYAFVGSIFKDEYIANKEESRPAFNKICNSLDIELFKSPKGEEYYPLFCYIYGVKDSRGKFLVPKYDLLSYKSFYEIKEGSRYSFEFAYYLNIPFPVNPPEFPIKLLSDEKIFSTPSVYTSWVSSRYDEESWTIISTLLERDTWTVISFKTELINDVNGKKPLKTNIDFAIQVKRKILYRIIDVSSDIGFGVGTGAIAFSAVLEKKWPWLVVIGCYVVWAIGKAIIKIWRG